jgi:hypothetical protein
MPRLLDYPRIFCSGLRNTHPIDISVEEPEMDKYITEKKDIISQLKTGIQIKRIRRKNDLSI